MIESRGGQLTATALEVGARFDIRLPATGNRLVKAHVGGTYGGGLTGHQLNVVIDRSPIPTLFIDLGIRQVVRVNKAFVELVGRPEAEILGRPGRELLIDPDTGDKIRDELLTELAEDDETNVVETESAVLIDTARGVIPAGIHLSLMPGTVLAVGHVVPRGQSLFSDR